MTILEYYAGFRSLYTLGAAIGFIPPLIHRLFANSNAKASSFYPPFGDTENFFLAFTVALLLLTTFVVFVCCRLSRKVYPAIILLLLLTIVAGVGGTSYSYVHFVRFVPIDAKGTEIPVTVGYQRTKLANEVYPDYSDWQILRDAGPSEEKIQRLWTADSIWVVRFSLWLCYTITLASWIAIFSIAVYKHVLEQPARGAPLDAAVR